MVTYARELDPLYEEAVREKDFPTGSMVDLWTGVLHQALKDLFFLSPGISGYDRVKNERYKRMWRDNAEAWFQSDDVAANSFLGICALIGADPEAIRRRVLRVGTVALRERLKRLNSPEPLALGNRAQTGERPGTEGNKKHKLRPSKQNMRKVSTGSQIAVGGIS